MPTSSQMSFTYHSGLKSAVDFLSFPDGRSRNSDVPASFVVERIASHESATIFLYDLAEDSGFGALTKELAKEGTFNVVTLQTRPGAGLTLVGRLSQGSSRDIQTGTALTAYTTPQGLAQMAPALSILPSPSACSSLVVQVAGVTPVGPDMVLSPTLSPIHNALFSLPSSFAVFLSSTPQESVELAYLAYRLPECHVVHVFDHYSSAREMTHLQLPPQSVSPARTVRDAFSELGYGFFDYAGDNEAKCVIVLLNGPFAAVAKVIASQIPGLGVLVVRVLRPWDEAAFREILPKTVENVHVIDDVPSEATQGGLFHDVFAALFDVTAPNTFTVYPHRHTPQTTQDYLSCPKKFISFASGLLPSSIGSAVSSPTLSVAPTLKKMAFFSTSMNYLPSLVAQSFFAHRDIKTRHLNAHDAFSKPGGITVDHILLSSKSDLDDHVPVPFLLPFTSASEDAEGEADFLAVLDQSLMKTHGILKYARRRAPVLIISNWTPEEILANAPNQSIEFAREQELRIYLLDSKGIASKLLANAASARSENLEDMLGHLAFLRLYLGKGDGASSKAVERIARASFGDVVDGFDLSVVCKKAWEGLEVVPMATATGAQVTEYEVKPPKLKDFEFNAVVRNSQDSSKGIESHSVNVWHEAAKHIIFHEAFAPPLVELPTQKDSYSQYPALRPDIADRTYLITTTVNKRLTPREYDRNVFHLEFNTQGTGLRYAIGEALGIHGWNDTDDIVDFCKWYGVDPDQLITIPAPARGDGKQRLSHTRTVFQALQQQIDIFGRPPKSFYAALSTYATLRTDRMALYFISAPEGAATFKKLAEVDTVTFADVLKVYKSARPPIAELCELVGDIAPRHYSIASSQAAVGDRVDLLVVTVDWITPSGSPRFGQCTRYLAGLQVGQKVTVSIKPSVMKLPPDPKQPIIMAGLGTGAAPFRAFMQHRAWLAAQKISVGPLLYYFGSRHRSQEYLYGEEIEAYIEDKVITHAGLAFSRDGKKKIYIQHKMKEDAEMLVKHLSDDEGVFYLCGPTWPVPDVYNTLVDALVRHFGKTAQEAGEYLESLKEHERYVLEVY